MHSKSDIALSLQAMMGISRLSKQRRNRIEDNKRYQQSLKGDNRMAMIDMKQIEAPEDATALLQNPA